MSRHSNRTNAHQRDRWLDTNAERWIRHDAARFYPRRPRQRVRLLPAR